MHDDRAPDSGNDTRFARNYVDSGEFRPPINNEEIFRGLIADELGAGRLTTSRRRRIVQYAAHLGLNAVQVGELIQACRKDALEGRDPTERYHALRLVEPPPPAIPIPLKIALVVTAAILLDLLVIRWIW